MCVSINEFASNMQSLVMEMQKLGHRFNEFETCAVGDVVLVRGIGGHAYVAAQVWVHVSVQGQAKSILSCWTLKVSVGPDKKQKKR